MSTSYENTAFMPSIDPTDILSLKGARVLVTGGANGIGRACASILTELGAYVVIADVNREAVERAGRQVGAAASLVLDVIDEAGCTDVVNHANEVLGGIDGLINSAGVSDRVTPAFDVDMDAWQRVLDINLKGTFQMCRAAARRMIDQGGGAIVNLSSIYGVVGVGRRNAYGPSKAAVNMLTQNLACEWSRDGVRVNAIAPGYITTPMVAELVEQGKLDAERLADRIPLGRLGRPEEIGWAAAFLLSNRASYLTGAVISADGGWAAFGGAGTVATA